MLKLIPFNGLVEFLFRSLCIIWMLSGHLFANFIDCKKCNFCIIVVKNKYLYKWVCSKNVTSYKPFKLTHPKSDHS